MHAFAKVLAPRGGRTEAAPDPRVNPAYLRGDAGVGGWCCSAARRCARICRRMMRHARRRSEAAGAKLQVRVGWLAGTGREAAKDHLATARRGQPVGIQAASSPHRHSRRSFRSGGPPAPRMEAVNPNRTAPGTRAAHSITSSASASSLAGISNLRVLAVCTLMINSNLVARSIGRSAGFAPLRIRPA